MQANPCLAAKIMLDWNESRFYSSLLKFRERYVTNTWPCTFLRVGDMPDWQEVDETQLLIKAKDGESEAIGELYERYVQVIYRFAFYRLGNSQDAEDLTEEVFIRVLKALPNYRDQGAPFAAFLFRVARNALVDFRRRPVNKEWQLSLEDNLLRGTLPDPVEIIIEDQDNHRIRKTLDQLKDDYRMVLILRFISELSPEETAQVMGRSPGAIRVLQHRALTALRSLLQKDKDE